MQLIASIGSHLTICNDQMTIKYLNFESGSKQKLQSISVSFLRLRARYSIFLYVYISKVFVSLFLLFYRRFPNQLHSMTLINKCFIHCFNIYFIIQCCKQIIYIQCFDGKRYPFGLYFLVCLGLVSKHLGRLYITYCIDSVLLAFRSHRLYGYVSICFIHI